MTPSRAKEVLEGMELHEFDAERLRCTMLGVFADAGASHCHFIDAHLAPEELQAIALWMQDPESVVNAETESAEGWKQVTNYIKTGASK